LTAEASKWETELNKALSTEMKVTVEKEGQSRLYNLIDQYEQEHLKHTLEAAAAEETLRKHLALVASEMQEVTDFGGQLSTRCSIRTIGAIGATRPSTS
jgi:hypothetical protein